MKQNWDDNTSWQQALLIAYDQHRQFEEGEELMLLAKARMSFS